MCIRDRRQVAQRRHDPAARQEGQRGIGSQRQLAVAVDDRCLLYTSDAADERSSVDLGGRRII